MGFADGHGVVGEVDIAVVACGGNLLANVILRKLSHGFWREISDVDNRLWLFFD